MTSITARYSRSLGSSEVEGTVRLLLEPEADWQREWAVAYAALKVQVDAATNEMAVSAEATSTDGQPSGDSEHSVTPEVSQSSPTVPEGTVEYSACRVMFDPNEYDAKGNRRAQVRVRIGNKDKIPVGSPLGYVNAKSTDPAMMALLRQLRKGDIVNVKGAFEEPWLNKKQDGSKVMEYDLVVEEFTRV